MWSTLLLQPCLLSSRFEAEPAEEQLRNSEFDLKVGTDNTSSRDPEISFKRVSRSVETHGQFTEDFTTKRRRQWISAISRERVTLFLLHSTIRCQNYIVGVIFLPSHIQSQTHTQRSNIPRSKKKSSFHCIVLFPNFILQETCYARYKFSKNSIRLARHWWCEGMK